jgi:hypothetical protein
LHGQEEGRFSLSRALGRKEASWVGSGVDGAAGDAGRATRAVSRTRRRRRRPTCSASAADAHRRARCLDRRSPQIWSLLLLLGPSILFHPFHTLIRSGDGVGSRAGGASARRAGLASSCCISSSSLHGHHGRPEATAHEAPSCHDQILLRRLSFALKNTQPSDRRGRQRARYMGRPASPGTVRHVQGADPVA